MNYLTIFNTAINVSILVYLAYRYNPFFLYYRRTTWMKKLVSISIMMVKSGNRHSSHSAQSIFTVIIRDPKETDKWDNEQFDNGNFYGTIK